MLAFLALWSKHAGVILCSHAFIKTSHRTRLVLLAYCMEDKLPTKIWASVCKLWHTGLLGSCIQSGSCHGNLRFYCSHSKRNMILVLRVAETKLKLLGATFQGTSSQNRSMQDFQNRRSYSALKTNAQPLNIYRAGPAGYSQFRDNCSATFRYQPGKTLW